MTKSERATIRAMFNGNCAYCGRELGKSFHVDHVEPMLRGFSGDAERDKLARKFPACQRCNLRKGGLTTEQFRQEIQAQPARMYRDKGEFRLAADFGMVEVRHKQPVFYFENFAKQLIDEANCRFGLEVMP